MADVLKLQQKGAIIPVSCPSSSTQERVREDEASGESENLEQVSVSGTFQNEGYTCSAEPPPGLSCRIMKDTIFCMQGASGASMFLLGSKNFPVYKSSFFGLVSYPGRSHKAGRGPGTHCVHMCNIPSFGGIRELGVDTTIMGRLVLWDTSEFFNETYAGSRLASAHLSGHQLGPCPPATSRNQGVKVYSF